MVTTTATTTSTVKHPSAKKRKQPPTDADATTELAGPSTKRAKKHDYVDDSSTKDKKSKKKKKKHDTDDNNASNGREFNLVSASLVVSLAPVFASNPRAGVEEMLDSLIMRYNPALRGVTLSHSNLQFQPEKGKIQDDCPYATCHINFNALVWSPTIGMKLSGKVNLSSPDHISLLVHRTFNVSIPKHHIPEHEWVFEYGAIENDPEFNAAEDTTKDPSSAEDIVMADGTKTTAEEKDESNGAKWIHAQTGETIGGKSGYVTFTVIGMTIANQMLSLVGSLQSDPFNPLHVPHKPTSPPPQSSSTSKAHRAYNNDLDSSSASEAEDEDPGADFNLDQLLAARPPVVQSKSIKEVEGEVAEDDKDEEPELSSKQPEAEAELEKERKEEKQRKKAEKEAKKAEKEEKKRLKEEKKAKKAQRQKEKEEKREG